MGNMLFGLIFNFSGGKVHIAKLKNFFCGLFRCLDWILQLWPWTLVRFFFDYVVKEKKKKELYKWEFAFCFSHRFCEGLRGEYFSLHC